LRTSVNQLLLNFHCIPAWSDQPLGTVPRGIYDDTDIYVECVAQHNIGCLAAHATKFRSTIPWFRIHRMTIYQCLAAALDALALLRKSRCFDGLLQIS